MKTILVVYSNVRNLSKEEVKKQKYYAFNSKDLQEGDIIKSPNYTTDMVVVKVLPVAYKYYNMSTGELSNDYNSTSQREIRELVIREDNAEVVYASFVHKEKRAADKESPLYKGGIWEIPIEEIESFEDLINWAKERSDD